MSSRGSSGESVEKIAEQYLSKPWVKYYDEGVPETIEIPEIPLYSFLMDSAKKFPDRDATIFILTERAITKLKYARIYDLARRFASFLKDEGIGKGDVIALFLPNSPQFIIAYYGALFAGATVTPMNILYRPEEIARQLRDSGATLLVSINLKDFADRAMLGVEESGTVEKIVWTGFEDFLGGLAGFLYKLRMRKEIMKIAEDRKNLKLSTLLRKYEPLQEKSFADINPREDIAVIMYTGGTTGVPKGAELTHYNLVSNVYQIDAWYKRGTKGKDVFVGALPWFHIYGQTTVMNAAIFRAATILVFPRFNVDLVMWAIERFKANLFHGVPLMYQMIINSPNVKRYDLRSLEACISGAAPLPEAVATKFEEITGARLREGYGLTETSPVTHVNPIFGKAKKLSIGLPLPNTIAAVADPEKPVLLPAGVSGELVISGPQVMKGYHNMPEENEAVFFECCGRRWLRTGDIAYMDEEGYFYIVDRKKDIIKYKGYSVYPREIEEVLYKHPCVLEAAVIGKPHPEYFEIPKAFIVVRPECKSRIATPSGREQLAKEIIEFARKKLAPYKVPKEVEFREELPKSAVGKILRRLLREEELKKLGGSTRGP
ncbi:MAG: long-chain fatty acid--CoA ligase [Desulfurococcales archaeon]|nr:long-chain fatty acid--CoA ligase [Desulfurococcales archaeon]